MKRKIRLSESTLKRMIAESVKRAINEINYNEMPLGDFAERNNWWKTQVDADFPSHNVKSSKDWQGTYDELSRDKASKEKEQAKQEKIKAREEAKKKRETEMLARKKERASQKREKREIFEKAVWYTLEGDESFLTPNQSMAIGDEKWGDDEWNEWSDGLKYIPLYLRTQNRVKAEIHGVGLSNDEINRDFYANYDFVLELGVSWGEGEDNDAGIILGVNMFDDKNAVSCNVVYCSNKLVNKYGSNALITNYVNRKIRQNMSVVLAKEEKWKNYQFKNIDNDKNWE